MLAACGCFVVSCLCLLGFGIWWFAYLCVCFAVFAVACCFGFGGMWLYWCLFVLFST